MQLLSFDIEYLTYSNFKKMKTWNNTALSHLRSFNCCPRRRGTRVVLDGKTVSRY